MDGRYRDMLAFHGIDHREVLKKAMLPGDILNRSTITMTEEQYYRFLDAINAVGNVPGLAVALATTGGIERFSPPIFASWCSKNARMCVERLSKYKRLIGPMRMEAEESGGEYRVSFLPGDPRLELPGFMLVSEFAFLINIIRRATKEAVTPLRITMINPAVDPALDGFAGVSVTHGTANTIVFRSADMLIPFISCDEGMWDYFEPELRRRLSDLDIDDSTGARVRAALSELLPAGLCGIDDVAGELGLSRRTLQRKLAEENTTFQKQLNSTRELLALNYARNTEMTSNDIAFLLGYAELNSFLRAFALWTGKSFSVYRSNAV